MPHITFLNRHSDILIQCGHLPHWFQPEAVQFITFRLADSLPQTKLQELALMREALGRRETKEGELTAEEERLEDIVDGWLMQGYGGCVLSNAQCRQFVEDACSSTISRRITSMPSSSCPTMFIYYCRQLEKTALSLSSVS